MASRTNGLESERYLKSLLQTVSHEELGRRLRAFRLSGSLSIRELADQAMVSKSSIVSIEQGRGCRPVTLEKVCRALNLHVERLANPQLTDAPPIQKVNESQWFLLDNLVGGPVAQGPMTEESRRRAVEDGQSNRMVMFDNIPADAGFIAGIVEIDRATEPRSHSGAELGYVIQGILLLTIDGVEHEVHPGESFYVRSGASHAYGTVSTGVSRILLFRLT